MATSFGAIPRTINPVGRGGGGGSLAGIMQQLRLKDQAAKEEAEIQAIVDALIKGERPTTTGTAGDFPPLDTKVPIEEKTNRLHGILESFRENAGSLPPTFDEQRDLTRRLGEEIKIIEDQPLVTADLRKQTEPVENRRARLLKDPRFLRRLIKDPAGASKLLETLAAPKRTAASPEGKQILDRNALVREFGEKSKQVEQFDRLTFPSPKEKTESKFELVQLQKRRQKLRSQPQTENTQNTINEIDRRIEVINKQVGGEVESKSELIRLIDKEKQLLKAGGNKAALENVQAGIKKIILQPADDRGTLFEHLVTAGFKEGTKEWNSAARAWLAKKAGTSVSVRTALKAGEELGKEMAKLVVSQQKDAEGARVGLLSLQESRQILNDAAGITTGTGAKFLTALNSFLTQRLGFDAGADETANTQAFAATMGTQVGQIIKQFGSGTGLSDADREYAERIVGGDITLNEAAIRRLIDINERAFRNVIRFHNKRARSVNKWAKDQDVSLPFALGVDEKTLGAPKKSKPKPRKDKEPTLEDLEAEMERRGLR